MLINSCCLAKVLWTGQTKNLHIVRGSVIRVSEFRILSATSDVFQFPFLFAHNQYFFPFILAIIVPLCQTSCPLRTVHCNNLHPPNLLSFLPLEDWIDSKSDHWIRSQRLIVHTKIFHISLNFDPVPFPPTINVNSARPQNRPALLCWTDYFLLRVCLDQNVVSL